MPNPSIVHHLHGGRTPCEMRGVPRDWPAGHTWSVTWTEVTCSLCRLAQQRPQVDLVGNIHDQVARVDAPANDAEAFPDDTAARVAQIAALVEMAAPALPSFLRFLERSIRSGNSELAETWRPFVEGLVALAEPARRMMGKL